MAFPLKQKARQALDFAIAWSWTSNYPHKASDLFFPKDAIVDGCFVEAGTGLTVNVTHGILRSSDGSLIEVPLATNQGTIAAPASGNQTIYLVSVNDQTAAITVTAGATALVGKAVAPTPAAGQIPMASLDVRNGDVAITRIDNITVRTIS